MNPGQLTAQPGVCPENWEPQRVGQSTPGRDGGWGGREGGTSPAEARAPPLAVPDLTPILQASPPTRRDSCMQFPQEPNVVPAGIPHITAQPPPRQVGQIQDKSPHPTRGPHEGSALQG